MPIPLLATLSATARAAYPIIKSGVSRGLSANAIQGVLRAQNMGIRRQVLLDIVRAETGIERAQAALKFVGLDRIPNPARLPTAITRMRRRYAFTVQVAGRLLSTGESIVQHVTVSLDSVRTRRELERMATDAVIGAQDRYGLEIEGATLVGGLQAGESGVL